MIWRILFCVSVSVLAVTGACGDGLAQEFHMSRALIGLSPLTSASDGCVTAKDGKAHRERWTSDKNLLASVLERLALHDRAGLESLVGLTSEGKLDLRGLALKSLPLADLDLAGADLSWASIEQCVIEDIDLSEAKAHCASFVGTAINGSWFNAANMPFANFDATTIVMSQFHNTRLDSASFRNAVVSAGTSFEHASLHDVDFQAATVGAWFTACSLLRTKWTDSILQGNAFFRDCDLSRANFHQTVSISSAFYGNLIDVAALTELDFSDAAVSGSSFILRTEESHGHPETGWRAAAQLRVLTRRAADIGHLDLADSLYVAQRELAMRNSVSPLVWIWEFMQGQVSGWGAKPSRILRSTALTLLFCGTLFALLRRTTSSILLEETSHSCGFWDCWVFSAAVFFALRFSPSTEASPVAAMLSGRRLVANGWSLHIAAGEWIVGKFVLYLAAQFFARKYWF